MGIGVYSDMKGIRSPNFNGTTDDVSNGTANYRLQDVELCLLMCVQEKSLPVCLNLETEAPNHDDWLYFLYLG